MERLQHKNIRIVVDATKDLLTRVLPYKPFLIKPNNHELSEIFNRPLSTKGGPRRSCQSIARERRTACAYLYGW